MSTLILSSCSLLSARNQERSIQTKIIKRLTVKSSDFEKCAVDSNIFTKFGEKRLRITLLMILGTSGEIEKFSTENTNYPDQFSDCLFSVVDKIKFPKPNSGTSISITQPFIFVQK